MNAPILDSMSLSLGQALSLVRGWLDTDGPVAWLLAALGTLALAIVLLKWWQFAAARLAHEPKVNRALQLWCRGDAEPALKTLQDLRSPRARIVLAAMLGLHRRAPEALVREETERVARARISALSRYLRTLGFIGNVSPLIGLLGTVIGMISAFQAIEAAGSQVDPALLSGGIWTALLTTAAGLVVAIPVSFLHGLLERRLDQFALSVSDAVTRVFTAPLHQAAGNADAVRGERPGANTSLSRVA